jgi:hypothetical protein
MEHQFFYGPAKLSPVGNCRNRSKNGQESYWEMHKGRKTFKTWIRKMLSKNNG